VCNNEKYLLESINSNIEYSFDTICSTKQYWKSVKNDQAQSINKRLYPYVTIKPDNIKLSLVGSGERLSDLTMKILLDDDRIDSHWISNFYDNLAGNRTPLDTPVKSAIGLSFYHDSIVDFSKPIKDLAHIYIAYQRTYAKKLFNKSLCELTVNQLDSIKRNIPWRIHLARHL
ncbi:MAG TPA: hypothetical protein VGE79_09875, partial [Niastella sp.]